MSDAKNRARSAGRKCDAFTLVELLVVIAIIAILASMIMPAVARSIESARSSSCLNNLRQMSVAAMNYSMDEKGRFPNFQTWLCTKPGDLTTGRLFPYVGAKSTYLCPTDKKEIDMEIRTRKKPKWVTPDIIAGGGGGRGGRGIARRDYSYAVSCGMCHAVDTAQFISPSKSLLYMEAYLATNDYNGEVGPSFASRSLALRHTKQGNLVMADLHLEQPTKKRCDAMERTKIFWFPTGKTTGPGGMNLGGGLQ